jgi:hypothetical protein
VNFTRNGPFDHDLALSTRPVPSLADAEQLGALEPDSSEFMYLRTKLIRERNRVDHSLKSAERLVVASSPELPQRR